MPKKRVFIICTVRSASDEYRQKLEDYTIELEAMDCIVHLPHRDTDQEVSSLEICLQNRDAIRNSDEIHIFYNSKSTGTHFDLGMAFWSGKKIVIIENEEYETGGEYQKSFPRMLDEWQAAQTWRK